jgi:O-antigen ligase
MESADPTSTLPLSAQLPGTAILIVILLLALGMVKSASGRFVVLACWLRFVLSAFHVFTHEEVVGGLSINALGSAGLFMLGVLLLPRSLLLIRAMVSVYAVMVAITLSSIGNGAYSEAFDPLVKFGLFIVIALNCYNALREGDERRFGMALLLSFSPLLLFQAISLILNLPKGGNLGAVRNYIGGYDHEAAFSVGLMGLFVAAALAPRIPPRWKVAALAIAFAGILLANYRTAILAITPLLLYYVVTGIGSLFDRRMRPIVTGVAGAVILVVAATSLVTLPRFADLRTIAQGEQPLIQPPNQFTEQERQLLTGRSLIWSTYYYEWKDQGSQLQHLVGFGPNSWEERFRIYAHNSFLSFLFEYGILGLFAVAAFVATGFRLAWRTGHSRWKLLSAHLCFLLLTLATMPMWLVEGLILYGILWGFTLFYRFGRLRTAEPEPKPVQLRPVAT